MSSITANNSLLDYEARSKSHSRHIRNYQKVSESNLDDSSIISYLKSRRLTKTLTTFIMQTNSKKNVEPLLEVFLRGGKIYEGSIQSYWQAIRDTASKNNQSLTGKKIEDKKTKLIKLQLYIHIWYCISENELDYSRLNSLKLFIKNKGETLSQIPELLSYFALPYVDKGVNNPVVKRIFSEQWKNEVRSLLQELIGIQTDSMEQQWFNIIVDMIEICEELINNISIEGSSHNLKAMVERVKLYKTVVEKNKIEFKNQLANQEKNGKSDIKKYTNFNVNNVKQTKANILQFSEMKDNQSLISIMTIYNKIQKEIFYKSQINIEKQYVKQLIKHDILFIKDKSNQFYMEYQWFKLLKIMSSYHKCRDYLSKNIHIIKKIIEVTESSFANRDVKIKNQMFLIGIGIIQRVIVRQQLFEQVNKNDKIYEIIVVLIKRFELDFEKTSQGINIFENLLGCILGAVMHRKGRIKISKTYLFQVLVGILKRLQNMNNIIGVQSLICSTIYLLLVQHNIRTSSMKLNLKDVLLSRMFEKKSSSYDTYVQYIIQRIERNEEQKEIDSDEDVQNDEEFDHNITIGHQIIILSQINGKKSGLQSNSHPYKHVSIENQNIASNIKELYARDRYSWKKKWLKQ